MSVEDRSWMYQGWSDNGHRSEDWVRNTDAFLDLAFSSASKAERSGVPCPCTDCRNGMRQRSLLLQFLLLQHKSCRWKTVAGCTKAGVTMAAIWKIGFATQMLFLTLLLVVSPRLKDQEYLVRAPTVEME
jgi:hypothetical protein